MSREIKFRAWDKENKKMYEVEALALVTEQVLAANGEILSFIHVELMQYTGVKDKNGKEIYEGDVVLELGFGNGIVKFGDAEFYIDRKIVVSSIVLCKSLECDYEILGNIYEHPNLLQEQINENK